MSCLPYSNKTMHYVGKYHILGSGGTVLYLFCRYGMQIMFHCNLLGIAALVDMSRTCQKGRGTPFISLCSSTGCRTAHKREEVLNKKNNNKKNKFI